MNLDQKIILAVYAAILSVGIAEFKKCSFFISNDKQGNP